MKHQQRLRGLGRRGLLYLTTFIVAFCSIIYELLLAQGMSILMGDAFLRFSLTMGLYLFFLALGALFLSQWPARKDSNETFNRLFKVEFALSCVGLSLPWLMVVGYEVIRFNGWHSEFLGWLYMHSLVAAVGFLSGLEVPLLMEVARHFWGEAVGQKILAIDYIATCFGALVFPWFVYEKTGFVAGCVLTGWLNLAALMLLARQDSCGWSWRRWGGVFILGWVAGFEWIYALDFQGKLAAIVVDGF